MDSRDPHLKLPFAIQTGTLSGGGAGATPPPVSGPGPVAVDLTGTDGDDTLDGSDFADTISGEGGNDVIHGYGGDDILVGGGGNDTLVGGSGNDQLSDASSDNILLGEDGNDRLSGGINGSNLLDGGAGDDRLLGGYGNDTLIGGAGDDTLSISGAPESATGHHVSMSGGEGNDVLIFYGDWGASVSGSGGAGADIFRFNSSVSLGDVTVTDFSPAQGDKLDLLGILRGDIGNNPFGASGFLKAVQSGHDVVIYLDRDGAAGNLVGMDPLVILKDVDLAALTPKAFVGGLDPSGKSAVDGIIVTGPGRSDSLAGGAGDDILHGGGGDDFITGGGGRDTAFFDGKLAAYTIRHDGDRWYVSDTVGIDGTDTLIGVERLQFVDQAVALDLDGVAAQAYRIYRALFDRTPDLAGLGYWIGVMDKGASVYDIAGGFIDSQEFRDLYGSTPTNAGILSRMYQNILHRAPDQAGYDYWLDILDNKKADVAGVLQFFSESTENKDGTAELIAHGIVFTPWTGG